MEVLRDQAILIARTQGGGQGRMLSFLTAGSGKVRLYYRLFPRRRRLEFLDPLRVGELLFTPSTDRAPGRFTSFHAEEVWPAIRGDYDRLVHALHFARMIDLITGEGEPLTELYNLLHLFLLHLERGGDPPSLRIIFELRLLQATGSAPSLESCFACRRPVPARGAVMSPGGGGVVCPSCVRDRDVRVKKISAGALSLMRKALTLSPDRLRRLKTGRQSRDEIRPLVDELIAIAFENLPPSTDFLNRTPEPPDSF